MTNLWLLSFQSVLSSLASCRARRKKCENVASAPALFDAPSMLRRVIQENYASIHALQRPQGARWAGNQAFNLKGLTT